MAWRQRESKAAGAAASHVCCGDGHGRTPKGYVPMLVGGGGDGDGEEERILVPVRLLKEPSMAALLEMAAQQFGYGQPGVLRIPCDARRFAQMVNFGVQRGIMESV